MHEHIVTRSPGVHENWPHLFERNVILTMAQQKLADLPRSAPPVADRSMLVRNPRAILEGWVVATEKRRLRPYRLGFVATAMLLVAIAATLPFSLTSILDDVMGPPTGKVFALMKAPRTEMAPSFSRLHVAVTAIDETHLFATLRVSGHHTCSQCGWTDRALFVSLASDDGDAEGLPPSASVTLPASGEGVSKLVELPLRGFPIRYPYDRYDMILGVAMQRIYSDGRIETVSPEQTPRHLSLSLQELLPSLLMSAPEPVDAAALRAPEDPVAYAAAYHVSFERPRYLRILAVLLVVLIASAASYSVFLRPLADLIVNAGALVLGIWGVRTILTPGNIYYLTAVDLSLSMIILFLLGGLAVKALMHTHDKGEIQILRRPPRAR